METKVKAEGWANVPLESLITFALGGDWGKDPESKLENYTDVYCIRGAEELLSNVVYGDHAVAC
ncbi:hypothetical protein BWP24_27405 (plasmid) [Vibrio campbellii]|nr:hypothetical protein BWP24_27405 [Vibrio campbellii]ARR10393.1 unknow [Vibrio campbellii]